MKRLAKKDWLVLAGATTAVLGISLMATKSQQSAFAQEDGQEEGRIVQISPDAGLNDDLPMAAPQTRRLAAPDFWIGVSGRPVESPVLRTHLQLAEGMGVVIEAVVPGGPAEKAGLRKHDVVIGVNGDPAMDMTVLQEAVLQGDGKPVDLKVIRLAEETTIEVTPAKPPADFAQQAQRSGGLPFQAVPGGQMGNMQELLQQLQQGGFRNIGPGMVFQGQRQQSASLPNGVAVTITRDGEGPAKITVKQGDETWTVEGDDEKAIAELPENLQPMVRRMMEQNGAGGVNDWLERFDFGRNLDGLGELEQMLPNNLGNFDFGEMGRRRGELRQRADETGEKMMNRMEQLEQRIEQLQQR
ncbi:MAG: PDZ domain-containing protein, partial [Planctomycetota bacterium]